jgi:hypothetical protein
MGGRPRRREFEHFLWEFLWETLVSYKTLQIAEKEWDWFAELGDWNHLT